MRGNNKFIYKNPIWDPQQKKATFSYQLHHKNEVLNFTETLIFPSDQPFTGIPQLLLKNVLGNLSLALGISYYKLYCPKEIILEGIQLSKEQADFWNTVYTKGLGEFFYKNRVDFRGLISFPFSNKTILSTPFSKGGKGDLKNRSLVGIGGGKDSIVAAEILKSLKKPFTAFIINSHSLQKQVAKLVDSDILFIKREIDPLLLELNKKPEAYNGHVPVSSIYAFIGLLAALLYDYRYIIVSNEKSANYGNTTYLGETINHQWSKSFEFEQLFHEYVKKYLTPDVKYFSLLRPLNEISIGKLFSNYPQYFPVFSSCNKNFKITGKTDKRWCGECAKCAFTFAILAAFLPKNQLLNIFGQNLFNKISLMQTYKELLGVEPIKPFDCVGTAEEVKVAFYLAMKKKEYENDIIMKFFQKEVLPKIANIATLEKEVFKLQDKHGIPYEFMLKIL